MLQKVGIISKNVVDNVMLSVNSRAMPLCRGF